VQPHAELRPVRELAAIADKIWQARNAVKPATIAAIPTDPGSDGEIVDSVADAVAAIKLKEKSQPRSQPSTSQQHHARKRHGERPNKKSVLICWVHAKYGDAAHHCADKQCGWRSQGN